MIDVLASDWPQAENQRPVLVGGRSRQDEGVVLPAATWRRRRGTSSGRRAGKTRPLRASPTKLAT